MSINNTRLVHSIVFAALARVHDRVENDVDDMSLPLHRHLLTTLEFHDSHALLGDSRGKHLKVQVKGLHVKVTVITTDDIFDAAVTHKSNISLQHRELAIQLIADELVTAAWSHTRASCGCEGFCSGFHLAA